MNNIEQLLMTSSSVYRRVSSPPVRDFDESFKENARKRRFARELFCLYIFTENLCIVLLLQIGGNIANTGHSVIFTVDNTTRHHVNVTGGPLSYKYQFQEMHIHYGLHDDSGSEHSINGYTFPAEVSSKFFLC